LRNRNDPQPPSLQPRPMDPDDPDLPLADLFRAWPQSARLFLAHRTACVGCPIAPFHTVRDACAEYRLDEAAFRAALAALIRPPRRSAPPAGAAPSP
jgi:hybrid cluster-associated redox disulfide protein